MKSTHFWHRSSVAVFALTFSILLSIGLASAGILGGSSLSTPISLFGGASDTPEEEGGDGYLADDDCGFLQGTSNKYHGVTVALETMDDDEQACLDAFAGASTGTFHSDSGQDSYITLTGDYGTIVVDLAPSGMDPSYLPAVDMTNGNPTSGNWSGYGKIISTSAKAVEGETIEDMPYVWFDWECTAAAACDAAMLGNEEDYYVQSNLTGGGTGSTYGYAWSDYLAALRGKGHAATGFFKMNGTNFEEAPRVIVPYVTITANETEVTPGSGLSRDAAPQANGIDFWKISTYFVDVMSGGTLDASEVQYFTVSVNTDDSVFVNQVTNAYDAVDISTWHPTECPTGASSSCIVSTTGDTTFNTYVRSYGPTSDMVYMTEEVAFVEQDMPTDRDGCIWIYFDQLDLSSLAAPARCNSDTTFVSFNNTEPSVKWDYFYARSDDRNYITLEDITFQIDFESDEYTLRTDDNFVAVTDGDSQTVPGQTGGGSGASGDYYRFTPTSATELSFSPRMYLNGLYAEYDGASTWTTISSDLNQENMYLLTDGGFYPASQALKDYLGTRLTTNDNLVMTYQLDAGTDYGRDRSDTDFYLVMDTVDADITDAANNETYHKESVFTHTPYFSKYAMGYSYSEDACSESASEGTTCPKKGAFIGATYLSNPSAEIWACDSVLDPVIEIRGVTNGKSCYYIGYLPVIDNHADPGGVLFMGTTGEFLGLSLDESDDIYEGGAEETIKIRNNFYELATRYTLGQTASSGTLDLDTGTVVGGVSLMGGSLYFFNGDVTISEASSFNDATVYVLGGDVYMSDVNGGRLGVIALAEGDVGGNIIIDNDATDIYANMFADGSVLSEASTYDSDGFPSWLNDAYRMAALKNQLYINGSITARMILNPDDVYSALGTYTCGGAEVTYEQAFECSLENLRQFRLCFELDDTGSPSSTYELCDEEEELSDYGEDYAGGSLDPDDYPSIILDYTAPGNLPIFASDGIFN
jgi:hypothetical protein